MVEVDPGDLRVVVALARSALVERVRLAGSGRLVDGDGRVPNVQPLQAALVRVSRSLDVRPRTSSLTDEYESAHDAGQRLGISARQVRRRVGAGKLAGETVAGVVLVRKDSRPCQST